MAKTRSALDRVGVGSPNIIIERVGFHPKPDPTRSHYWVTPAPDSVRTAPTTITAPELISSVEEDDSLLPVTSGTAAQPMTDSEGDIVLADISPCRFPRRPSHHIDRFPDAYH